MASYQARRREPLLDQTTQAMLERRGRELLGVVLVALALAVAALLGSYSPQDPGWMVATDAPVQNLLGRAGAAMASTLMIISGLGAWGIAVVLAAWGLRYLLHRGENRALGRAVFAVIAVALASVFAATHVPGADWPHSFGLGGLFGDTVLGAVLGVAPVQAGFGLKLASLVSGLALLGLGLFVTGFDRRELRAIGRFLLVGLVVCYAAAMWLAGRTAIGTARAASALQARRHQRRAAAAVPAEPVIDAAPAWGRPASLRADPRPVAPQPVAMPVEMAQPRERHGLLARMPQLMRRVIDPAPAPLPPRLTDAASYADLPSEDRIRARISDAIRVRAQNGQPTSAVELSPISAAIARREPAVTRAHSPLPSFAAPRRGMPIPVQPVGTDPEDWAGDGQDDAADLACIASVPDPDDDFAPLPVLRASRLMIEPKGLVLAAVKKPTIPSRRAEAEAQPHLKFDDHQPAYELPPLSLLSNPDVTQRHQLSVDALEENARMLESVLDDYGVKGEIVSVRPGPVVTMYELEPAPGLKASRVIGLADDIARSMSALSARVSTVPGRTVIGIELPNVHREKVVLREILSARDFGDSAMRLPLALGKDIGGEPVIANLAKMPHLLIAGTTGSGKSVAINTMILSLLYKLSPEECRLIMIDPKMLELSVYDGIPHLLSPVVTDPKKAVVALKWVVGEMEERYRKLSRLGVRNIEGYNGRVREALARGEAFKRTIQTGFDVDTGEPVFETDEYQPVTLPYIVVVVDEMADLMMVAGKEIEACIQRLAQMARASGIHLIMATQRPSVDVITGTIKANFPTRISFQVTSKIDSRTILGEQGAEQLLGMGDMLYMAGGAKITRIHGPFVSDEEVEEIVNHLKSYGPPDYMSGVVEGVDEGAADDIDMVLGLGGDGSDDALYDQAVAVVAKDRKCSTSYIQRKLGIGYNKAARLVEQMEDNSVVTPANHVGKREILLPEH